MWHFLNCHISDSCRFCAASKPFRPPEYSQKFYEEFTFDSQPEDMIVVLEKPRTVRLQENNGRTATDLLCQRSEWRDELMSAIDQLKIRDRDDHSETRWYFPLKKKTRTFAPVIPPQSAHLLLDDINNLPEDQRLAESGQFEVFHAEAIQIPNVLIEIGRLREITFRQAGEGTGKLIDLDEFDEHYNHLFLWNRETSEIVGAYRLGETDAILTRLGKRGLYTNTLFEFYGGILEQLSPALEMGRSFVRAEYQRSIALLLLWKGIGRYVARRPRYRILFGPVSIDNKYHIISRQLMVEFLKANSYLPELARLVRPRAPFRPKPVKGWNPATVIPLLKGVDEASAMVCDIEDGQRGIPVLLRQYLRLGGKLLGFNVDSTFGDVLDGLILVDLMKTERRMLERYLGKQGAAAFLEYHEQNQSKAS
jgi:putative hemolysin